MRLKSWSSVCAFIACVSSRLVLGGITETDFKVSESPLGWDLDSTLYDQTNGRKFFEDQQWMASPLYDGSIVSLNIKARMFGSGIAGSGSVLKVQGRCDLSSEWVDLGAIGFISAGVTNHSFKVLRASNFRQLKFIFFKGAGTLRIQSVGVEWRKDGEVSEPYGLKVDYVNKDSFCVSWSIDEMVDGFILDCWNISFMPWSGNVVWSESFDKALNEGKSPKAADDEMLDFASAHLGWIGSYVYFPAGSAGELQVGKASEVVGALVTPPLSEMENVELVVRARAFANQSNRQMSVVLLKDSSTNQVAVFTLETSYLDYHCCIPKIENGERIMFNSFDSGSQRRVGIDSIALVSEYSDMMAVTNFIESGVVINYSANSSYEVKGLEIDKEYYVGVRAFNNGKDSLLSGPLKIKTVEPNSLVEAVKLSSLSRVGSRIGYKEDFSSATNIFASSTNTAEWENGKTFDCWQAFRGAELVDTITRNFGAATSSGLYVYCQQGYDVDSYSLGTMTSATAQRYVYGLVFKNDFDFEVDKISVEFDALQYGFKNEAEQVLYCEYCVEEELTPIAADTGWVVDENLVYVTVKDVSSGLISGVDMPVGTKVVRKDISVSIPPGGYFMLRWRRMAAAHSAAIAIDNLKVDFERKSQGLRIVIR